MGYRGYVLVDQCTYSVRVCTVFKFVTGFFSFLVVRLVVKGFA